MRIKRSTPARPEEHDAGFTLIELLVVVLIIGILAAIAIPVFLAQRAKGYDAAAQTDLRTVATAEEAFLASDTGTAYTATPSVLATNGFKPSGSVDLYVAINAGTTFCAWAGNEHGSNASGTTPGRWFVWDRGTGGLSTTYYSTAADAQAACSDAVTKAASATAVEINGKVQ